jgi:predicted tellurium resistance membrane protein TerC
MSWIATPEGWIALVTLTALELVLGIDNVVFISILAGKLERRLRTRAWRIGLGLAMLMRIALLLSLAWIIRLTAPLFSLAGQEFSGRDLILLAGGLFLLAKATHEIHQKLEGGEEDEVFSTRRVSFGGVVVQIVLLDIVFSLDSVITAVGMVKELAIMVVAIVLAVAVMLLFAQAVSEFVERHPTIKMLALSFLLLVGMALVADAFDLHIPRGYVYFAMGYSIFVEMLNIRLRRRRAEPVRLHERFAKPSG